MRRSTLRSVRLCFIVSASFAGLAGAHAQTVMQQCGQQYQAAKAANTLNGMTWNQFRTDCAAKLKGQAAAPAATPAATQTANPLNPPAAEPAGTAAAAPAETPASPAAAKPAKAASAGRTAFVARERQCGSEWRANKASLTAQTPGLTWPKFLSQCNARLKAAGK